jgi:hypothetical protein
MADDLKRLRNPFEDSMKEAKEDAAEQTKIYFDNLHLSPLKVNFSLSH